MPLLKVRTNYRYDILGIPAPGDTIGVRLKNGEYRYYSWRGFLDVHEARQLNDAIPVKLDAVAYSINDLELGGSWISISNTQAIQGCFHGNKVYGVTSDGVPRLVSTSMAKYDV